MQKVIGITGWVFGIVLSSFAALAQQVPGPVQEARASVYRVVYSAGNRGGHATAWAVNPNTLITNAHVVQSLAEIEAETGEEGNIFVVGASGRRIPVISHEAFAGVDVATLRVASSTLRPLQIQAGEFPIDTPLWNLSYPGVADFAGVAQEAQVSAGNIQEYFDFSYPDNSFNITRVLKHDAASGPGSSGSPILNACGAVIGLHFSGLSDDQGAGVSGASRLAISSQMLVDYLAVESRSTRFDTASTCRAGGVAPWMYYVGGALILAAVVGFVVQKGSRVPARASAPVPATPRSPITPAPAPRPVTSGNTLMLRGTDAHDRFEVQADFRTGKTSLQVGSSEDPKKGNDIILRFRSVSRVHAKIERLGQSLLVTDLGSANGTIVRGNQIPQGEAVTVSAGETISIADIEVEVVLK